MAARRIGSGSGISAGLGSLIAGREAATDFLPSCRARYTCSCDYFSCCYVPEAVSPVWLEARAGPSAAW
jgi:hypothetical protein